MFIYFQRAFTVLSIIFLVIVFVLPSRLVGQASDELQELIELALAFAEAEDQEGCAELCTQLVERFESYSGKLSLFIDHSHLDVVACALKPALTLAKRGDFATASELLSVAGEAFSHIRQQEKLSLGSLF